MHKATSISLALLHIIFAAGYSWGNAGIMHVVVVMQLCMTGRDHI